jgi:hypothetical protein
MSVFALKRNGVQRNFFVVFFSEDDDGALLLQIDEGVFLLPVFP